jgi:hypothetical protein
MRAMDYAYALYTSSSSPPPRSALSSDRAGPLRPRYTFSTYNYHFLPFFFFLLYPHIFSLPSGDRLASIVFLFETGLLPNIDDAAPRLPLSRLSCYRLGPLLFFFSEAGSHFFCVA